MFWFALSKAVTLLLPTPELLKTAMSVFCTGPESQLPEVAQVPDVTFHVRVVWATAGDGAKTAAIATAAMKIAARYRK